VYAFEALPHYAHALRRLLWLLRIKNVRVRNEAVSNKVGTVEIAWRTKQGRKLTGNTHVAIEGEEAGVECVAVPAVTLDAWLEGASSSIARVVFIKIDVEGAEIFVLRGARQLLNRYRPVLFMEIVTASCAHYGYRPQQLFELVEELGYQPYRVLSQHPQILVVPTNASSYPGKGDVLLIPSERSLPVGLKLAPTG
jgi:FkbM family methyltransferase